MLRRPRPSPGRRRGWRIYTAYFSKLTYLLTYYVRTYVRTYSRQPAAYCVRVAVPRTAALSRERRGR
eukprot:scaffold3410_cov105-Isochrysis_galbana.AAC.2